MTDTPQSHPFADVLRMIANGEQVQGRPVNRPQTEEWFDMAPREVLREVSKWPQASFDFRAKPAEPVLTISVSGPLGYGAHVLAEWLIWSLRDAGIGVMPGPLQYADADAVSIAMQRFARKFVDSKQVVEVKVIQTAREPG